MAPNRLAEAQPFSYVQISHLFSRHTALVRASKGAGAPVDDTVQGFHEPKVSAIFLPRMWALVVDAGCWFLTQVADGNYLPGTIHHAVFVFCSFCRSDVLQRAWAPVLPLYAVHTSHSERWIGFFD